jgi:hypothetical protein
MSQFKEIAVGGTVYFWFAANTTAGDAGDGATPLYDVRLAGASSSGAPTASGTPTLLSHANYTDGLHEIAIDTTGYAEGEYAVFTTLTISGVTPAGFVGSFVVRAAASTLRDLLQALITTVGTSGAGLTNINLPNQTMDIVGNITGNLSGSVGSLTTNNDKTGYALSATGSAALTEGYAADGAAATLPQLLYMLLAVLTEVTVSGTTMTAKKLDGSTTAGTFTLNDAADPTSITRAT